MPGKQGQHYEYFNVNTLAKTDIDMVIDAHVEQTFKQLKILANKLYKRNPREWKKAGLPSRQAAIDRIFQQPFPTVNSTTSTQSIRLAFDQDYQGDRVLALVAGMGAMLSKAYNNKQDFYLLDNLDPQKLYNSARNIEIAAWLLRSQKQADGSLYLLSYGTSKGIVNQSFERLIGKIVGQQDTIAFIIARKNHRVIKNTVQSVAQLVFLPV